MTKKIMFNDKFCLTKAVLGGTKTMTRRLLKEGTPLGNWEETEKYLPYKVGDIVAVAQSYNAVGRPQYDKFGREEAGNTNKMFVKSDLLPHHIRITDLKVERLQSITDDDIMREGIYRFGQIRICF